MSQRRIWIFVACLCVIAIAVAVAIHHRAHSSLRSEKTPTVGAAMLAKTAPQPAQAPNPHLSEALGKLPLSFEDRSWQTGGEKEFVSVGSTYALGITSGGAHLRHRYQMSDAPTSVEHLAESLAHTGGTAESNVELTWLGANSSARPEGEERQPGVSNYLLSSDRKQWHTHVAHYGGVRLPEIYNGIDLRFHGDHKALEFDFLVKPGSNASDIRIGVGAPSVVGVAENGDLEIQKDGDAMRLQAPTAYQEIGGARKPVEVKFALAGTHEVRFALGAYDKSEPLVIDPVLAFSAFFGSSTNFTTASDIALDASGNIYITGRSCDVDYPVTPGAYQGSGGSIVSTYCDDAIITELDPTASTLVYSTYLGPANAVTVGMKVLPVATGTLVAGFTSATNFPTTSNAYQKTAGGGTCTYGPNIQNYPCSDGFVLELSPDGSDLVFSTYFGGTRAEILGGMAVDKSGNIYVSGGTNSADFPVTTGAADGSYGGGMCQGGLYPCFDGFVSKLSGDGSQLLASTYLGGNDDDFVAAVAVDSTMNVYVAGTAYSTNFPTTAGSVQPTHSAGADQGDAFVSKLTPDMKTLTYSTYVGGTGYDIGLGLAVDSTGEAYVLGTTDSTDFPITSGSFQTMYAGPAPANAFCPTALDSSLLFQPSCGDIFVTKLNAAGSSKVYSTFIGGSQADVAMRGGLDSNGNMWLLANTNSTDFPFTPDAYYTSNGTNVALMELSADGSKLLYATPLVQGNAGEGLASGLVVDSTNDVYVAGQTESFMGTPGTFASGSGPSIFIAKYTQATAAPAVTLSATSLTFPQTAVGSGSQPQSVTLTNSGTATLNLKITTPLQLGATTAPPFSEYDNCGTTLAAGASCTINATYQPNVPETGDSGIISVVSNAPNAPHIVSLSGTTEVIDYASFVPATLTFNGQGPGTTSATQTSGLQSPGSSPQAIVPAPVSAPVISGPNASEFQLDTSNCQIGQHYCTLNVTFSPAASATGTRTATVTLATNAPNTPHTLSLVGNVSAGPYAVISGPFLDPTNVGTTLNSGFSITNTGGATLNVTGETLSGANPGDFVLSSAGCSVPSFSLAPGQACSISIAFTPSAQGTRTATMTLVDNETKPLSAVFTGFGSTSTSAAFVMNVVPNLTNSVGLFPDTVVGTTGISEFLISVQNLGKGSGNITSTTLTGDYVQTNTCSGAIAPSNACQYTINFAPTTTGARTGTLTIVTNAPGNQTFTVNFSGNGVLEPLVSLTPSLINFGPVALNTPSTAQTATLKNTGNGPLSISNVAITGPFTQTNTCGSSLAAGANCAFSVIFTPTTQGNSGGLLSFKGNAAGGFFAVALNGSGVTGAAPQLTPTSLNFGNQAVGTVSPAQTVTLSNAGTTAFTYSGLQVAENFQATSNCPASIAAGESCTISVKFAPTTDTFPAPFPASGAVYVAVGAKGSPLSIQTMGTATQGTGTVNIALGSTPNPSTVGQNVTFTATVTPTATGGPTPTGTIQFQDAGNPIGSPVTLTGGTAVLMYSALAQGNHSINCFYSGDSNYEPVASSGILQTVNAAAGKASTTTTVSSTPNPATAGQSVKFTATVTSGTPGTITGTVTFFDGATQLGSPVTLSGGSAPFSTTTLSQGSHSITAQYSGDTSYNTSTSTAITQTINAGTKASTTSAVSSSFDPSTVGANVTFTATVTSGTAGTITGTVTFFDGATQLGSPVTLSGGSAPFSTTALSQGTHSITAQYSGDANYTGSTSTAITQTVNPGTKASTTSAVSSSLNPSTVGASVTFTATVTSGTAGTITGSVAFLDGATALGPPVALTSGAAVFSTSSLAQGTHSITAVYSGDTNYLASTSPAVSQVVNGSGQAATTTMLTSSLNPSTVGATVMFTATVASTTPGTISGSVSFFDGAQLLDTPITMTGNIATLTDTKLSQGTHTITARYNGNTSFAVSTSAPVSQVVNGSGQAATTTMLSSSLNPSTVGASVMFTATVTSTTQGTISGSVSFFDGAQLLDTPITMTGNIATLIDTKLSQGTHTITARYNGNTNFAVSTSAPVSQVVNASNKAATTTAVTSSLNPSTVGASVTFTATVAAAATTATITGTATFFDGATQLGSPVTISGGTAVFTTAALTQGTHSITAQYSGDTNYSASTSTAVSQVVNAAGTGDFSVSVAPTSLTVQAGRAGSFTVSIAPVNGSTQTVTLGCSQLPANSSCSFATPSVTLDGVHTATVTGAINTNSKATISAMGEPMNGPPGDPRKQPPLPAAWQLVASLLAALGSLALIRTSRNRAWRLTLAMALLMLPALAITACSNPPSGKDTPKGNYTVLVTGTSGTTTHSTSIAVTVN